MAELNGYNGVLIINKPTGMSSHRVVSLARKALNMKKIGHTGTLDPAAEGVLPLLLGNATKASEFITAEDKTYRAVILLGTTTDTLDMTGTVTSEKEVNVSISNIEKAIEAFTGRIDQTPPMYSAIQLHGQRLYTLARQGIEVERKPRKVTVYSIKILNVCLPRIEIEVCCSKGTYIRTLAADIGDFLGCGGCIDSLTRTRCGDFDISDSVTPEKMDILLKSGEISNYIIPTDHLFPDYTAVYLDKKKSDRVKNGVPIYYKGREQGDILRLYDENRHFIALSVVSESDGRDCLKMIKGFY